MATTYWPGPNTWSTENGLSIYTSRHNLSIRAWRGALSLQHIRLHLPENSNPTRALVIGKFGGLGYAFPRHCDTVDTQSYQDFNHSQIRINVYAALLEAIETTKDQVAAATVYTHLTDIETEINGRVTYDRKQNKIPVATPKRMHQQRLELSCGFAPFVYCKVEYSALTL